MLFNSMLIYLILCLHMIKYLSLYPKGDKILNYSTGSIKNGKILAAIKKIPNGYFYVMDIIGDYREEVIRVYEDKKGGSLLLQVYTNTSLINKKRLSPWEDRKYAVNKRWAGR